MRAYCSGNWAGNEDGPQLRWDVDGEWGGCWQTPAFANTPMTLCAR